MKKILISLVLLILAAGFALAQDAAAAPAPAPVGEFHNSLYGVFYPAISWDGKAPVSAWGPDWAGDGGVYNDWKFSYTSKNYGFYSDLHFSQASFSSPNFYDIAAWFKFNDVVKLTLGKINNGEYNEFSQLSGDWLEQKFFNEQFGSLVQAFPVPNLSVALAYYVPGSNNAGTTTLPTAPDANFADNFGLAASYTVPNVGVVHGFYKAIQSTSESVPSGYDLHILDVGGNAIPVKDWYFSAEYQYDFSASAGSSNKINTFYAGVKYTGIPNVPIVIDENVSTGTQVGKSSATYNYIEGSIEYDFPQTPWAVGFQTGYDNGIANSFDWEGNAFGGGFDDFTSLIGGAEIYPYAQYNFDHGSFVKVGFLYLTGGISVPGQTDKTPSSWSVPVYYSANF